MPTLEPTTANECPLSRLNASYRMIDSFLWAGPRQIIILHRFETDIPNSNVRVVAWWKIILRNTLYLDFYLENQFITLFVVVMMILKGCWEFPLEKEQVGVHLLAQGHLSRVSACWYLIYYNTLPHRYARPMNCETNTKEVTVREKKKKNNRRRLKCKWGGRDRGS